MNLFLIFTILVGWLAVVVVTAFVFWRRLHRELPEEYLLQMIGATMISAVVMGRTVWWLGSILDQNWQWQWWWQISSHPGISWVGVLLGGILAMRKLEGKYKHILGEIGDAFVEAIIWGVVLVSLGGLVRSRSGLVIGDAVMAVVVIGSWYWLRHNYRKFGWYGSGRVGFLWWAGLSLLSLTQLIVSWASGRWIEVVYNGLLLLISAVGIYTISGRNFTRDARQARERWFTNSKL